MIFCFYIFDKTGKCLYYQELNRPYNTFQNNAEEQKLVFGLIYSLRGFVQKLSTDPYKYIF